MSKLPPPQDFTHHKSELHKRATKHHEVASSISEEQLQKELDSFEPLSWKRHEKELLEVSPQWLYKEAHSTEVDLFMYMSRFDGKNQTFVTGCYENSTLDFKLISYKRRRFRGGKWITRKDTHPNNTPLVRIYTENEPIIIIEGHHDALNAILLGLDFIMIPTATYKDATKLFDEVKNRDVIFIVEEEAAYRGMKVLADDLRHSAKSIRLKSLSAKGKVDLSDYCFSCKSINEVKNGLYSRRFNTL